MLFLSLLCFSSPCIAQETQQPTPEKEGPKLKLGTHCEFSKDPVFNYNLYYTSIEAGDFKLQYDIFNNPAGYQRIWILPRKFTITQSPDFVLSIAPGFSVSNNLSGQTDWLFGADVDYAFPTAHVQILQRSYKGNHFDQHYLLSAWQPLKNEDKLLIVHFMNISDQYPSTSYIGPAANVWDGKLFFWTGASLTKSATWSSSLQLTIEF